MKKNNFPLKWKVLKRYLSRPPTASLFSLDRVSVFFLFSASENIFSRAELSLLIYFISSEM
jgi:hypothetical protein